MPFRDSKGVWRDDTGSPRDRAVGCLYIDQWVPTFAPATCLHIDTWDIGFNHHYYGHVDTIPTDWEPYNGSGMSSPDGFLENIYENGTNSISRFTDDDVSDVASDDDDFQSHCHTTTNHYVFTMFETDNDNNTDLITRYFRGKFNIAPSSSTVYMYIWDDTNSVWHVASHQEDSSTAADTELELYISLFNYNNTPYYRSLGGAYRTYVLVYQQVA